MDGAGAGRGRKDGPPETYLGPLNPHGSPFFFGSQKPFLFLAGKKKWSLNVSPVLSHNRKQWADTWFGAPSRRAPQPAQHQGPSGKPRPTLSTPRVILSASEGSVSPVLLRMVIGICFTNMTFPPQGGGCPAGADEGALDRTKREIYFTDPPSSVICFANATFPLKGGR